MKWTNKDIAAANKEGWCISACYRDSSENFTWEVQRLDEAGIFDSDKDVFLHIWNVKNDLHTKALRFIKIANSAEYERIRWAALMNN